MVKLTKYFVLGVSGEEADLQMVYKSFKCEITIQGVFSFEALVEDLQNKWRDKTFKGAIYNKPHIQTWSGLKKEEIAAKQLEYDQMIEKN